MKILIFSLLALVACGPIPLAQAEQQCLEPAQLAQHPRGTLSIGVNQDGDVGGSLELGVSTDYLQGRDPSQVYDTCVMQRSGQMPSQPYYTLPQSAT